MAHKQVTSKKPSKPNVIRRVGKAIYDKIDRSERNKRGSKGSDAYKIKHK